MQEKVFDEIGNVKFLKNNRSRKILITVKPFEDIRVSLPRWTSYAYAFKVVENKTAWIKKAIQKVNLLENKRTIFDYTSIFSTKSHKLVITLKNVQNAFARITEDTIFVTIPVSKNINDEETQSFIRKSIIKVYRQEAKEYISRRTSELASKYDFRYQNISIRDSKTRWGSCTHKNNLNFSLYLMQLPDHLIDFIILHELIHTRIKNHKKEFWNLFDKYTGNAKALVKELNSYKIGIF